MLQKWDSAGSESWITGNDRLVKSYGLVRIKDFAIRLETGELLKSIRVSAEERCFASLDIYTAPAASSPIYQIIRRPRMCRLAAIVRTMVCLYGDSSIPVSKNR